MTFTNDLSGLADMLLASRLVVFDFDGVLADSVDVKTRAFAEIYRPYGADVVARVLDHHRRHGGMSRFDKFRHYHREFLDEQVDETIVRQLADRFSDIVKQAVIEAPEIPGACSFLEDLKGRDKLCAVNSATPEQELDEIIAQRSMKHLFVAAYGSPASKQENLDKILQYCAVPAERAVFFGDAGSDFEAASACGVGFAGVGDSIAKMLNKLNSQWPLIEDFRGINDLLATR